MNYKIAIVTPYYEEPADMIERCVQSVRAQGVDCVHILVADGKPLKIFDGRQDVLHLTLPRCNADYGNTPRGLGAMFAEAQGFDAVAFLDADNWFEPDHIAELLNIRRQSGASLIACKRQFFSLSGEIMTVTETPEDHNLHVDTSCWLIFREAFGSFKVWFLPKEISAVCDRIFFQFVQNHGYTIAFSDQRTVCYLSRYAVHYLAVRMPIPLGADHYLTNIPGDFLQTPAGMKAVFDRLGFYPAVNWES